MGRVGWLRVVGECGGYPMAKRQLEVVTIVQGRKEGGYPLAGSWFDESRRLGCYGRIQERAAKIALR